tara:strand:- start:33 stop:470 length:438 start_codon:yes stop_codon:yes gene_type:complete
MTQQITNQIAQAFATVDAIALEKLPKEIKKEREFIKYRINNLNETWRRNSSFYEQMAYGEEVQIQKAIAKMNDTHEARNQRIAKKLNDKGINNIDLTNVDIVWGDNFQTLINVGNLQIDLRVVWAGGYDIQCLHNRVLCNVKEVA